MPQCITPFTASTNDMIRPHIPVPCGKCPNCVSRRVSAWSFRLMQEDKISLMSNFITLTYDTKSVPISRAGFMSISKRDIQLFFKRLRKSNEAKIKYFCAGEYGTKTGRPHYHIILFNARVETIQEAWPLGGIHYGTVSGASVGYTLKYISKPGRIPEHKNDDRQPEFRLMSKGLGASYVNEKIRQWHKASLENRVYVNLEDGKKASMPRYYKDKIYSENERKRIAFFGAQKAEQLKEEDIRTIHEKVESDKASFRRVASRSKRGQSL